MTACATSADRHGEPAITVSQPQAVDASQDIFNSGVMSQLVPGMVVAIRVSPTGIQLERASMMLVSRASPRIDRGDRVVVSLFGVGSQVSQAVVSDPVYLVIEGQGVVRTEDRVVVLAIPTPDLVDTLEVAVTSTGQRARFDVTQVMRGFCASAREEPACRNAPRP